MCWAFGLVSSLPIVEFSIGTFVPHHFVSEYTWTYVTKAVRQSRIISIRFVNGTVECSEILSDFCGDTDEQPTWSEKEIEKLYMNSCYAQTSSILKKNCHWIPEWCFPIEWVPCEIKENFFSLFCGSPKKLFFARKAWVSKNIVKCAVHYFFAVRKSLVMIWMIFEKFAVFENHVSKNNMVDHEFIKNHLNHYQTPFHSEKILCNKIYNVS